MDLERMLNRCRRERWTLDDLAWGRPVSPMPEEMEAAIVQSFHDMAGIERLAAALFAEQAQRTEDPALRRIFEAFVEDEIRHAEAAILLAARHDTRKIRRYGARPALSGFAASFVAAVRHLPLDVAGAYIMVGELILDMALLRSLDDAVADPTTHDVMRLINRDESRHIAVDVYMFDEYYASEAYARQKAADPPMSAAAQIAAAGALLAVILRARPFFREVLFEPMARIDPSGRRLREVFRRLQLLARRPRPGQRPFVRFIRALLDAYEHPLARAVAGPAIARLVGVEPALLERLYTESELRRVGAMSLDELTGREPS